MALDRYSDESQLPVITLRDFLTHVGRHIPNKWQSFGIELGIPLPEMDTYRSPNEDHFIQVYRSWERRGTPELSWRTVEKVLESPLLNEKRLAVEVKELIRTNALSNTS